MRAHLKKFEDAGVDQVIFIQQAGKNQHEHICDSLELFAEQVMPEFKEREEERTRRKMETLAPYIEKALSRVPPIAAMDTVPPVDSYPVLLRKAGIEPEQTPGSITGVQRLLGIDTNGDSRGH